MPKPQIQILVCTHEREPGAKKPSCGPRGAMDVYHRFKDRIKELGLRDQVMVVRTGCLKHCSQGTTCALWPQNQWLRRVTVADVDEVIETCVQRGEELDRLRMPDVPWE
jgi:(2Fe-2S) ferredoxin